MPDPLDRDRVEEIIKAKYIDKQWYKHKIKKDKKHDKKGKKKKKKVCILNIYKYI